MTNIDDNDVFDYVEGGDNLDLFNEKSYQTGDNIKEFKDINIITLDEHNTAIDKKLPISESEHFKENQNHLDLIGEEYEKRNPLNRDSEGYALKPGVDPNKEIFEDDDYMDENTYWRNVLEDTSSQSTRARWGDIKILQRREVHSWDPDAAEDSTLVVGDDYAYSDFKQRDWYTGELSTEQTSGTRFYVPINLVSLDGNTEFEDDDIVDIHYMFNTAFGITKYERKND